jgi:hypothetical protein
MSASQQSHITQRMNKDKFPGEGIRKLNSEILQLDNQRFLLTTTAVVFFGTVAGWVTTALLRTGGSSDMQQHSAVTISTHYLLPVITALIWGVLYVMFHYQSSLALTVRWLAAYQMLKGSDWEWTWYAFRKQLSKSDLGDLPFAAYDVITLIFRLLIGTTFGYFLFLHIFFVLPLPRSWEVLTTALTPWHIWALLFILLLILLRRMGRRTHKVSYKDEIDCLNQWKNAEDLVPAMETN